MIRGVIYALIGHGGSQGLRLVSNVILSRMLFPQAFGLMAIVRLVLNGLELLSDAGVAFSIIRDRRGDEPSFLNTAWTIQIIRGVWG